MKKTVVGVVVACLLIAISAWGKVGGGDITFSVKGAANVVYSHDVHVTKLGNKCTECHYRYFKMSTQQHRATMAEMQAGKSCGACHNGQKAFSVKENCSKCHK
jgi:c(7)-type cytochrome triheme protein